MAPSSSVSSGRHVKSHWKRQEHWPALQLLHIPDRSNASHESLMVHLSTSNCRGQVPYRGTTITAVCKILKSILIFWSLYSPSLLRWALKQCCATLNVVQDKRSFEHNLSIPSSSSPRRSAQLALSAAMGAEVIKRMPSCKDRVIYQLDYNAYKYHSCITGLSLLCGCCMKAALVNQRRRRHNERWQFDFKPPWFPLTVSGFWCTPHRRILWQDKKPKVYLPKALSDCCIISPYVEAINCRIWKHLVQGYSYFSQIMLSCIVYPNCYASSLSLQVSVLKLKLYLHFCG